MRAAPQPAPLPENLGETMETSRSAFDATPARRPAKASIDHESTQYLISSVMPHPLARAPSNEQQPTPNPEPVPPPRPMREMQPLQTVQLPKPPIALFIAAAAIVLLVLVAATYALTRR